MYTVNGDYVTTVHDSKRGNTSQPSIKSLTSSKDGAIMGYEERDPDDSEASTVVFVALNDKEEREISRNRVTDRSIFDMSYCENTSSFVALSARGIINDDDDASQQIKGYENYLFVLGVAYTSYGTFTTARQTRENIIGSYAEYFYTPNRWRKGWEHPARPF